MIDYILTAAVGISAGVGALISAVPSLQPHTLQLCLGVLLILTIVNMRGVHDTGVVFMIPTYLFTGTLLIVIVVGMFHAALHAGGHPHPVTPIPALPPATAAVSFWLLLKVFSSGCTAMTGVEAVSNGVMAFRDRHAQERQDHAHHHHRPADRPAARHRGALPRLPHRAPPIPIDPGYESVLSMLTRAVMGHGWFYYLTIGSVLLVLALSANTAFADFPRLTRAIALNNYMPHVFLLRGRRLLYSWGIYVLVALTAHAADHLSRRHRSADSRSTPSARFSPSRFRRPAWSCTGSARAAKAPRPACSLNGLGAVATGITVSRGPAGQVHRRRMDHGPAGRRR